MKRKSLSLLAGFSLLIPVMFALRNTGSDSDVSPFYPHPAVVLIPMFLGLRWIAFAIPTALFFAWNLQLFQGRAGIPKRSYILFGGLALLTIAWFLAGWKDGLAVQGRIYNRSLLAINVAWIAVLCLTTFLARKRNTFGTTLLFHWLLFLWLAWHAFPFFGEMI